MKKTLIKALSLMLAFVVMFGSVNMTASAANQDKKAQAFCKKLNKGNKFGDSIGSYKVTYKKQGKKYNFTVTFNDNLGITMFAMVKAMTPDKYIETRNSVGETSLKLRKKAKKAGIKKPSVTYIYKTKGVKLWEYKDGKLIYERL